MNYIYIGAIIITLAIATYFGIPRQQEPTFSSTQQWDEELFLLTSAATVFTQDELRSITLPEPPANNSDALEQDMQTLHYFETLRTPEKLSEISREISIDDAAFGSTSLSLLARSDLFTHTSQTIQYALDAAGPVIFQQKQHYDRVRPSLLDPTLQPAIAIPLHPAYPSGHATQAHLVVLILEELDPENKETYAQAAERIARNRVIAGVHYPSDSEAGKLLASQLHALLHSQGAFISLMEKAKREYGD